MSMFLRVNMEVIDNLAKLITEVAKKENDVLSGIPDLGIFHMPELAFAYECGKAAMLNSAEIFGHNTPIWVREKDLGNGGPTDLLFEFNDGNKIAIEFKLRDNSDSYKKDVVKLSKLPDENTIKIFCALIDVFDKKLPDDGRQEEVEANSGHQIKVISKSSFPTKQNWYQTPTSCVVCLWLVGEPANIET